EPPTPPHGRRASRARRNRGRPSRAPRLSLVISHARETPGGAVGPAAHRDRLAEIEDVALCPPQEPRILELVQHILAGRDEPCDGPATVGHLHATTFPYGSQDASGILLQSADADSTHVRRCSTKRLLGQSLRARTLFDVPEAVNETVGFSSSCAERG